MNNDKANYINTLINVEDRSTYKVHEHLAKDIVDYIDEVNKENNSERPFPQIIGLEGPWGSGKSNLIKLIKKGFDPNKNKDSSQKDSSQKDSSQYCTYHDFIFNIWENQGASIEKAFLKYLLDDLILNKILVGKTSIKVKGVQRREKWTDLFDIFTAKKQYEKSFLWGTLFIFAFLLAFFIKRLDPSSSSEFNLDFFYNYSFLCVVCFVLILIGVSFKRFTTPFRLFPIKSTYTEVSSVGIYSEDFKNLFKNISKELQKQNKILIINFDNIDRCNNEKAQEVLSLIYTVFSEHVYKNIWVILTYDYDKLAEVILSQQNTDIKSFQKVAQEEQSIEGELENTKVQGRKDTTNSTSEESQENAPVGTQRNEDFIKYNYVDGFLNKILPVIYKVPANITLDYKNVFDSYFNEAFEEFYNTEKKENKNKENVSISLDKKYIYKLYRTKHKELIYRDIISFINQLVLYKNRQDIFKDIDLLTIAVYILYEKELKQVKDIFSYIFPESITTIIYEYGETNINLKLASIVYQVKISIAKQLQIIKNIEDEIYWVIQKETYQNKVYKINQINEIDSTLDISRSRMPQVVSFLSFSPKYKLSTNVFTFIKEDIFPNCWKYCCETFTTELLMRGIVTWCKNYEEEKSCVHFQNVLNKVAELVISEDGKDQIKTINSFPFYSYLILFRYLKNTEQLENLQEIYIATMKSICNFLTKNFSESTEDGITKYIWTLFFIASAQNQNNYLEKHDFSKIYEESRDILVKDFDKILEKFLHETFSNYDILENNTNTTTEFLGINFSDFLKDKLDYCNEQLSTENIDFYSKFENCIETALNNWINLLNKSTEKICQLVFLFHLFDFIAKHKVYQNFAWTKQTDPFLTYFEQFKLDGKSFYIHFLGSLCRFYRQTHENCEMLNELLSQRQTSIYEMLVKQLQREDLFTTNELTKEYFLSLLEITVVCLNVPKNFFIEYVNSIYKNEKWVNFTYQVKPEWEAFMCEEIKNMINFWVCWNKDELKEQLYDARNRNKNAPKNSLISLIVEAL